MYRMRLTNTFLIAALAVTTLVFATSANAATKTWVGGSNGNIWSTAANWNPSGIPVAADDIVFNASASSVVLNTNVTVASLTLNASIDIGFTANATLTVSGATSLGAGASINLAGSAGTSLQLNGAINFAAGSIANATEIYSTSGILKVVKLGTAATLTMGDLRGTYFGTGVNVWITRNTGMLLSAVRFNDDITIDCEFNPGSWNVWLGTAADILRSGYNNQTQKYISFTAATPATGMVIKDIAYWQSSPGVYDPAVGSFLWEVGTEKIASITVDVNYARELDGSTTPAWSGPSATEPFRGVGVRTVKLVHPANQATNRYEYYWVVQPIGLDQDNGPGFANYVAPENNICYEVEFHPGYIQGSPQTVYSARYSENYEEAGLGQVWYSDGSTTTGTSSSGRVFVSQCPAAGFGDITIGTGTDPVPVELVSFSARYIDRTVNLKWETATELNNFGFAIERSQNGEEWEEIGFVPGYGTSSSPKSYSHTDELSDELAHLPQLAYRLRQIDRDGTTDYSNIVYVKTGELPTDVELYAAYPNPFNPATTISFAIKQSASVTLTVYNTFGQEVATLLRSSAMDAGLHTIAFNGDQLPSGVYMAVLEANGVPQYQKLVLNK